jgi:hypothetical protein
VALPRATRAKAAKPTRRRKPARSRATKRAS